MKKRTKLRDLGLDVLGKSDWGAHICLFYEDKQDILDALIPYFQAGLENNEFCVCVTSEPLGKAEVESWMRKEIPGFDDYLAKGQIELIPHDQWYMIDGVFDGERVLSWWGEKLEHALANGYDGLRASGDTYWVTEDVRLAHNEYDYQASLAIDSLKMLAICCYSLEKFGAAKLMQVVCTHQHALIRYNNEWKLYKSTEAIKIEKRLHENTKKYQSMLKNKATLQKHQETLTKHGRVAALQEVASGLAHQLNQPLAVISSYAQMLVKEANQGHIDEVIQIAKKLITNSDRASKIISGIREIFSDNRLNKTPEKLDHIITKAVRLFENKNDNKIISLSLNTNTLVPLDKIQIEQVLYNLIQNAVESVKQNKSNSKGKIKIKSEILSNLVKISIVDNGIGLPKNLKNKIFEPFITTKYGSMGVGLSICRSIVESHGGHLYISRSNLNGGAEISFTLPC